MNMASTDGSDWGEIRAETAIHTGASADRLVTDPAVDTGMFLMRMRMV